MSKILEKVQGGDTLERHIFQCYCGEDSYLKVMQDVENKEYYVSISIHPTRLRERLSTAWKALRGLEFSGSNHVIVLEEDVKRLIEALAPTDEVAQ